MYSQCSQLNANASLQLFPSFFRKIISSSCNCSSVPVLALLGGDKAQPTSQPWHSAWCSAGRHPAKCSLNEQWILMKPSVLWAHQVSMYNLSTGHLWVAVSPFSSLLSSNLSVLFSRPQENYWHSYSALWPPGLHTGKEPIRKQC